jgi:arabinan endo-1,5-alpha-L-arabinosidase
VRGPDPAAQETGGALRWPTQPGDLVGPDETASVLLRDPPAGAWTVETRLAIDLGTDDVRNFQQAGLVAYLDDDQFLRLSHVAIWNTRQTEFGKEMPFAGATSYGGMAVGTPAPVTWTLPAGTRPRVGLVSHGGAGAVARFDYLRIHQP